MNSNRPGTFSSRLGNAMTPDALGLPYRSVHAPSRMVPHLENKGSKSPIAVPSRRSTNDVEQVEIRHVGQIALDRCIVDIEFHFKLSPFMPGIPTGGGFRRVSFVMCLHSRAIQVSTAPQTMCLTDNSASGSR